VKTIVQEERLAGIYRGLVPTVAKVSTAQATRSVLSWSVSGSHEIMLSQQVS
jgi:hypothetical protein